MSDDQLTFVADAVAVAAARAVELYELSSAMEDKEEQVQSGELLLMRKVCEAAAGWYRYYTPEIVHGLCQDDESELAIAVEAFLMWANEAE